MTRPDDLEGFAERWSRLWAEDYGRMVDEIYSPDLVVVHAGWGEDGRLEGREGLREAEDRLIELIPDHENPIVRVVDGDEAVVIESVIRGTGRGDDVRHACPAVVWWRFDDTGLVSHETAFWEWSKRRPDDGTAAGTLREGDGRRRPDDWYRGYADDLARLWTEDPIAMVDEHYAEDCILERLGEGPEGIIEGADALRDAESQLLEFLPRPERAMEVTRVSAEDDVVAIEFTIEGSRKGTGPRRRGPGTIVLTLNEDDRIVSDRTYWHWSRAREVDA